MKLAELAKKASALPERITFDWPGAEHFHEDVFNREVKTLSQAIEYINELRKRMGKYSMALAELGNAYRQMRDLLLEFDIEREDKS